MFDLHGATLLVPKLFTIYDLLFDDVRKSYLVLWNCHESENILKISDNDETDTRLNTNMFRYSY